MMLQSQFVGICSAYLIINSAEVSQFNTLTLLFLWMFDLMSLSRDNVIVFLLDISLIFAWKLEKFNMII